MLAVAGCSATVPGTGSYAEDGQGATLPAAATDTATPTGDSVGSKEWCAGRGLSPDGASYCLIIPAGFKDITSSTKLTDATKSSEGEYLSAVAATSSGTRDMIFVTEYTIHSNVDNLSDSTIRGVVEWSMKDLRSKGYQVQDTAPVRSTVGGGRAYTFDSGNPKTGTHTRQAQVFSGKHEYRIHCQYRNVDQKAVILQGCAEVMATFQIAS